MIVYTPPVAPKTIPVVDLEGSNVPWEIHKACRETGFLYVANHRVPQALIDRAFWSSEISPQDLRTPQREPAPVVLPRRHERG